MHRLVGSGIWIPNIKVLYGIVDNIYTFLYILHYIDVFPRALDTHVSYIIDKYFFLDHTTEIVN